MGPLVAIVGLNILGGFLRANAARRAARATAAQERRNAIVAEMAAGDSLDRGSVAEGATRVATSEKIASDKSQLAASGVDVKSGSALDVLSGQAARGELLAQRARSNAMREAWGYKTQAHNLRLQADDAEQAGDQAYMNEILGGFLNAGASYAGSKMGAGGAGVAYPVMRIGEPTTFERGDFAPLNLQGSVA